MELKKIKTMKSSLPHFWEHFNSRFEEIEKGVEEREGVYRDLSAHALYTSPDDLQNIFRHHLIRGTFCDLGCGTGQAAIFYGHTFPDRKAIGVEFSKARIEAGQALCPSHVELLHGDLLTCPIPDADTYFLYFPTGMVLDRILRELYFKEKEFTLVAIESHGDLLPRLELENWLVLRDEVVLLSPRHYPKARIYQRVFEERKLKFDAFNLSFRERFLFIDDGKETWIGESYGLEWNGDESFNLRIPPRTIQWKDVKSSQVLSELDSKYEMAIQLRRLGEVTFLTHQGSFQGTIRKIIVKPSFLVEISSGERIEWIKILTITQGSRLCYASSSY